MIQRNTKTWHGCYDDNWNGLITPESFSHPAKMANGLVNRIFDYAIAQGWIVPGESTVVDPFGGIGSTGIVGASRGVKVLCCELEQKFVDLAKQNFELHRHTWEACGDPLPVIVQGDSRRLCEVLGPQLAACVIGSPPFSTSQQSRDGDFVMESTEVNPTARKLDTRTYFPAGQDSDGNLAAMPTGDVAAIISSPPYSEGLGHGGRPGQAPNDTRGTLAAMEVGYGTAPGNIGNLPPGDVAAIVSSPPFLGARSGTTASTETAGGGPCADRVHTAADGDRLGNTDGQLAAMPPGDVADTIKRRNLDSMPRCATMQRKGDQPCQPAKTAELKSLDEADGASHVPESTSANLSRGDQSHQDTGGKLLRQEAGSQCQTTGDQHMPTGQAEATVGVDSDGGHSENLPAKETATSASNVVLPADSKSTTKKKQSKRKGSGTTACQTSKRFVPSATLQGTETSSDLQSVQSAEQCTRPEHEASAVPSNAERNRHVEHKSDSTGRKPRRTPVPSAERNSDLLDADGNTAPNCASEQQDSESTLSQCESDDPSTFWSEAKKIVIQCHHILRPGGIAIFVCKDFVRKGQRVPFSADWQKLCLACGFEPVEWIKASLVKETRHPSLFGDDDIVERTERKGFFRRLAEKKGSPPIDEEDVIIVRKPGFTQQQA